VFTRKYCTELVNLSSLSTFEVEIWCYRGHEVEIPKWILRDSRTFSFRDVDTILIRNRILADFSTLCIVQADLSPLSGSAQPMTGKNSTYWRIVFSIEISFGLTEFRARLKWTDSATNKVN
jgi:hypothetical protein